MAGLNDSSGEDGLPSAKECEELCLTFSQVTGTNSAEAQMYLQEQDWNLERAVQMFFTKSEAQGDLTNQIDVMASAKSGDCSRVRILTWNLDGLDSVSLAARTNAVMQIINTEDPDIVFLQELVFQSWEMIKGSGSLLSDRYDLLPASTRQQYFTAVLLKRSSVLVEDHSVKPFELSKMERMLQTVRVDVKGIKMQLMTTHLESMAEHSVERVRQFKVCLQNMTSCDPEYNVIFGGDLNLRDKEVSQVGLPSHIKDIWELLGSKLDTKYTWDVKYNDNKQMRNGMTPRCRFDRVYFRPSDKETIQPTSFRLTGIERVKNCSRFPSDHWAVVCELHIK